MAAEILLVDDDPDLLKLIGLRLSAAGYRVKTAESGEAALAQIAVTRPAVVVTDLRMPGIDGMQLFEQINAQHPTLPVIILTAHGTIPDAVAATQRGVFGFLTKPFDGKRLCATARNALKHQQLSSLVAQYRENFERSSFAGFIGASMAMLFLFFTVGAAAEALHVERRLGVLDRVMAAPVSPRAVLAGKVGALSLLATTSFVVIWLSTDRKSVV